MNKSTIGRTAIALGAAAALTLALPLSANAHVRVTPGHADAGSYALLTFRVPTESATASTTRLEVDFPTKTPFSSVSYQPVAGWQVAVTTEKLATPVKTAATTITEAVTTVVWTADANAAIAPGQFQQFSVSAGPVPDTGSIPLPTRQTYSDGSVVSWDQPTPASGAEPEHPAPTLYVNDAPPSAAEHAGAAAVTATPQAGSAAPNADAGSSAVIATDTAGLWVALAGLALGAVALLLAVFALTRRARPAATASAGPASSSTAATEADASGQQKGR